MKPPCELLEELINQLILNDGLDRIETARLECLLKDPQLRKRYLEAMATAALMPEAVATARERRRQRSTVAEAAPPATHVLSWRTYAAVAAAIVIGAFVGFSLPHSRSGTIAGVEKQAVKQPESLAKVTGMVGVQWSADAREEPMIAGKSVVARQLAFDTGIVELMYKSGVRLTIEGPADFTITDAGSGVLKSGRLVTYVPHGAEGFKIDYPHGRIVDLGTEFALDVADSGRAVVGVFDGEIELHLPGEPVRPLFQRDSVVHDIRFTTPLRAVPFDEKRFIRRLPARDFRWAVNSIEPSVVEFDVSHLVWRASGYRAIFKWFDGIDAIRIRNVELLLDGVPAATADGEGVAGGPHMSRGNFIRLDVSSDRFRRGRWTLRAEVSPAPRGSTLPTVNDSPVYSSGIVQFEEGLVSGASDRDFIGSWSYNHLGARYIRQFHMDGSATLIMDGVPQSSASVGSRWRVEEGMLLVSWANHYYEEGHVLRDRDTLIFVNQPYSNAKCLRGDSK